MVAEAAGAGAGFVLTPEVTNCVSTSRSHQNVVLQPEADDTTLAGLREAAAQLGIWLLIGSLALKTDDRRRALCQPVLPDRARRRDCRALRQDPHVRRAGRRGRDLPRIGGYRPGDRAVLAETPFGRIGLTICYDMRFPALYRALAKAGAEILTVPAAFSPVTGAAHWETLLRARAIETGCFVLAPAQMRPPRRQPGQGARNLWAFAGRVALGRGSCRMAGRSRGSPMSISTWGRSTRRAARVPSLSHDRPFDGP